MKPRLTPVTLCALCFLCGESFADEATFTPLGFFQGGLPFSNAEAVSDDGQVVVGWAHMANMPEPSQPFRWTPTGGMEMLPTLPGTNRGFARGVSADGSVIAGRSVVGCCVTYSQRWTPEFTEYLGPNLAGVDPAESGGVFIDGTMGISADGNVIVGFSSSGFNFSHGSVHPYRWTEELGMVSLVPDGEWENWFGAALAASEDGSVIVGWNRPLGSGSQHPFRWTEETGMVDLGYLGSTQGPTIAEAVTRDGKMVVGHSSLGALPGAAFRWTQETGMVSLGHYVHDGANIITRAMAVAEAGKTVVGYAMLWNPSPPSYTHIAVIWDEVNGFRNLKTVLEEDYSLNLTGWSLNEASAVTPDGRFVVGHGVNPFGHTEGWLVELPVDTPVPPCPGDLTGSGAVGVPDLLQLLSCWGPVTPGSACAAADLTVSGSVGVPDLLQLLANWGPCP